MDSDAAAGKLQSVADKVVVFPEHFFRGAIQQRNILIPGMGEGVIDRFPASRFLIADDKREINDKGEE